MGDQTTDVLVIGSGFAGLCAAIEARLAGVEVLLLDAAPAALCGGNARHSRNIRLATAAPTPWQQGSYPIAEFAADLMAAGAPDRELATCLANGAAALGPWLIAQGVAFEPWADGNLPPSRRTAFFRGGGQTATHALVRRAVRLGVEIRCGWRVDALDRAVLNPTYSGPLPIPVERPEGAITVTAGAVVVATGGYGGDRARLRTLLGPAASGIANRGTPHQLGAPLWWLLESGAAAAGRPGDGHVVAVDARAPLADAGIVSRADGMDLGLVVAADGRRLRDEGAISGPARYAVWGQTLAQQDDPRGWLLLSPAAAEQLPPTLYPPLRAECAAPLARQCGIDAAELVATLTAVANHHSRGAKLEPPHTAPAVPLPHPDGPLLAIPLRPGLAFTRHGVAVATDARVRLAAGGVAPRLCAAGAVMGGAVLGQRYLSGSALTNSGVFGRIAGHHAARLAGSRQGRSSPPPALTQRRRADRAGPPPTRSPAIDDPEREARRALNICNRCGFCTALCDLFPAAKRRPVLSRSEVRHLAHLCHDCRSCYDGCQYAPPHPFAVNLPATLAAVRAADYRGHRRAAALATGLQATLFLACLIALPLTEWIAGPQATRSALALGLGGAAGLLVVRLARFGWTTGGPPLRHGVRPLLRAALDVVTLRNLGGADQRCEDRDGPVGRARRWSHHLVAGGFVVAVVAAHSSVRLAEPRLAGLLMGLGALGGVALLSGVVGLEWVRRRADPAPTAREATTADRLLGLQLATVATTGLALLTALASGTALGVLPALHAGAVLGLALGLPFGKLGHGGWRALALYRHAGEQAAQRAAQRAARRSNALNKAGSGSV